MKTKPAKTTGDPPPFAFKAVRALLLSCSLLFFSQQGASATTISANSNTILRMREGVLDDSLFPLYEYLNLAAGDTAGKGNVTLELGGWGRVDLADRSSDHRTEGDFQYGYLIYRGDRNNFHANVGRQWVIEGVATERIDGLYLGGDLAGGFSAAAFVGQPVTTTPSFKDGDLIYGGRLAHGTAGYYTIGVSALRDESDQEGVREEEGIDVWLRPAAFLDIGGRSTYNSLSRGWMEHAYTADIVPTERLRASVSFQNVHYDDYFHHVTTTALSLTNGIILPGEEMWKAGGSVGYNATKELRLSAEYDHYEYDLAGHADYYGITGGYGNASGLSAGASFHRMDGSSHRLRYNEYRAWVSQKFGAADVALDFFDVDFDSGINGRENTYSLAAAAGYDLSRNLRVAADIDYIRSADFDHELRGLVRLSYAFGPGKEGKP